jgi:hypothetical protein
LLARELEAVSGSLTLSRRETAASAHYLSDHRVGARDGPRPWSGTSISRC